MLTTTVQNMMQGTVQGLVADGLGYCMSVAPGNRGGEIFARDVRGVVGLIGIGEWFTVPSTCAAQPVLCIVSWCGLLSWR